MWKLLEPRSTAAMTSDIAAGSGRRSGAERRAAAAGGLGGRIADHELRTLQTFAVVDLGAAEILEAHRVDQQLDALVLDAGIAVLDLLVELEAVLQTRAATTLHEHPQHQLRVSLASDQRADFTRCRIGENQRRGFGFDCIESFCVAHTEQCRRSRPRRQSRVLTRCSIPTGS